MALSHLTLTVCSVMILCSSLARAASHHVRAGAYGSYTFDTPGTATVTIRRATAADHGSSAGWQPAYGAGSASWTGITINTSNIVIDGQTGGGPGSWTTGHGFEVVNTGAGSGGDGLIFLGAKLGALLFAMWRRRGRAGPVVAGMLSSTAVMGAIVRATKGGLLRVSWPWYPLIGTLVCLTVARALSWRDSRPVPDRDVDRDDDEE